MTGNDPLDRLRAADPARSAVSDPNDPDVRATLEAILVTDTISPTDQRPGDSRPDDELASRRSTRQRMPLLIGAAAALLLLAGVVGAVVTGDDDPTDTVASGAIDDPVVDDAPDEPTADLPMAEPLPGDASGPAAGSELTSCEESYSPETLPNRDQVFDGTVTAVDGPNMTFQVNEWLAGGDAATVTLDHQGFVGMLFAPDGPALEPGTRVLMAADEGRVLSCGFTQLHSEATAAEWRAAFTG